MNIAEIEEGLRSLVGEPFDPDDFPFRFLEVYGSPRATVTKLRQAKGAYLLGAGDVLVKKRLFFRPAPKEQAAATVDAMVAEAATGKHAPRFLMATDGSDFYAFDTKADRSCDTPFAKLFDSFDFFLPLAGIERHEGVGESPADIKATARLAKLYDSILEANPTWIGRNYTHELNLFMTRLLFCFFAEDTGIFDQDQFTNAVISMSSEDGSDTAKVLAVLFEAMDTPDRSRDKTSEFARRFPYVNGGLFRDRTAVPAFSKRARRLLRECGQLIWRDINPDIFGSMIQAVVEPEMRGDMGMHYTSVPNIMKALQPLFLMSLEEEFEVARESQARLQKLLGRIYNIRVFDPACGSGNFLIIAYRELRKLESRVFARQREIGQRLLPMTGVRLSQFYGIELADFAAETAKLSLWIAEYQMNAVFKAEFGEAPAALPLSDSGNIFHDNACRLDWTLVCPLDPGRETYIVGNPPYLGSVHQTDAQKTDMRAVFAPHLTTYKDLDLVAAWVFIAAKFIERTGAQAAFVATNSITQGEQVAMLWPLVIGVDVEISFAHLSFKWRNSAAHNAAVTCVVIGLRKKSNAPKFIIDAGLSRKVKNINPYLIAGENVFVEKRTKQISGLPRMDYGNKPTDDGNFILSEGERRELLAQYPQSGRLIRRFTGSREFIQGVERWCIWIEDENLSLALSIPPIAKRIDGVRTARLESKGLQANANARTPHRFVYAPHQATENILIPCHFSERREYLTVGYSNGEDEVIGNSAAVIFDAPPFVFAILCSRLHLIWTASVGGRLKQDLRYSNTLVYNTFAIPTLSHAQMLELEDHALQILETRESHPGKSIAWLYNPESMPSELLACHRALDEAIERMCVGRAFRSDAERLEYLFTQYSTQRQKLDGAGAGSRDLRRRAA